MSIIQLINTTIHGNPRFPLQNYSPCLCHNFLRQETPLRNESKLVGSSNALSCLSPSLDVKRKLGDSSTSPTSEHGALWRAFFPFVSYQHRGRLKRAPASRLSLPFHPRPVWEGREKCLILLLRSAVLASDLFLVSALQRLALWVKILRFSCSSGLAGTEIPELNVNLNIRLECWMMYVWLNTRN